MFLKSQIKSYLIKFDKIYKKKPVQNNQGGGKYPQLFGLFCLLKKIKPNLVIESGIYKGQSTYIIKKALPNAKIISIDIDLTQREYIDKSVTYIEKDFKQLRHNFSKKRALVFFDDHQNFIDRCMQSYFFGYKHIIFEDNYRVGEGDFYSLEHAKKNQGFYQKRTIKSFLRSFVRINKFLLQKYIHGKKIVLDNYMSGLRDVDKNNSDFKNLLTRSKIIYTFPPLYNPSSLKKIKPLLKNKFSFPEAYKERENYNFLTYINFK